MMMMMMTQTIITLLLFQLEKAFPLCQIAPIGFCKAKKSTLAASRLSSGFQSDGKPSSTPTASGDLSTLQRLLQNEMSSHPSKLSNVNNTEMFKEAEMQSLVDSVLLFDLKNDVNKITDIFETALIASERGSMVGWITITSIIACASSPIFSFKLNSNMKAAFIRCVIVSKRLHDIYESLPTLFKSPLPPAFSLENCMRMTVSENPKLCIEIFEQYSHHLSDDNDDDYKLGARIYSYAIQAYCSIGECEKTMSLLSQAKLYHQLSVGLVVTALMACRRLEASLKLTQDIFNLVKEHVRGIAEAGKIRRNNDVNGHSESNLYDYFEDGIIPDIIYGLTISNLAQGGAEIQTYQLLCEILEYKVNLTDVSLNQVILGLARGGAYNILFQIHDLLVRYRRPLTSIAYNAILNACDKSKAYGAALSFYFFKMKPSSLDMKATSVLLKACDRSGNAKCATLIILQAAAKLKDKIPIDFHERLFAIYLKTSSVNLALAYLNYLEDYRNGVLTFLDEKVQASELFAAVDTWTREIEIQEYTDFMTAHKEVQDKYLANIPMGIVAGDGGLESGDLLGGLDFYANFEILLNFKSNPRELTGLYTAMISLLASTRYPVQAVALLNSFHARGGIQTIDMFTSCIYAQRFNKDFRRAEKLLEELWLKSIAPTADRTGGNKKRKALALTISPFNALLAVYSACDIGNKYSNETIIFSSRRQKILNDIDNLQLAWDPYTYTAAFMNEKNKTSVLKLWSKFKSERQKYVPSYVQVIKVLNACLYYNNSDVAIEVVEYLWERLDKNSAAIHFEEGLASSKKEDALKANEKKLQPMQAIMKSANESRIYSFLLLTLYREGNRSNDCVHMLNRIKDRGITPSPFMYSIVLKALNDEADWKRSITILLQIVLKTKRLDEQHKPLVENVILTCIRAKEYLVAIKLIDELPKLTSNTFVPTAFMLTQYIYGCYKLKEVQKAVSALDRMTELHYYPNMVSVTQAISLVEGDQDYAKSIQIFHEFVASQLDPSPEEKSMVLDLHGFNQVLSRAAIRSALATLVGMLDEDAKVSYEKNTKDLVIITGQGRNSKEDKGPILKPSVKNFLSSFDPPLNASEMPDNPGRLLVEGEVIKKWMSHQRANNGKKSFIYIPSKRERQTKAKFR